MTKPARPGRKPALHFEQVPVAVVKNITVPTKAPGLPKPKGDISTKGRHDSEPD
jgi:hypothetical protein